MSPPRREHPVANTGFPLVPTLIGVAVGFWPMLVWHKPDPSGGPFTPDVTAWVVCGIWWGLLALAGVAWVASKVRGRQ